MPRFIFSLQSVLRHREHVEDECQRELAKVLRQRMILQSQLQTMQSTISQSKRDLSAGLVGAVNLDEVSAFARYSGQVTERAGQIVRRLVGLEKQIDQARQRLVKAAQDRQALELLKERQYRAWRLRQERREAAVLDDLAVQRHAAHQLALER